MDLAFTTIHDQSAALIQRGCTENEIFGDQPNMAALFDEDELKISSALSRWAAGMVHSIKLKGSLRTPFRLVP